MSGVACQSTDPHAHHGVPGPAWIDATLTQLRSDKTG